MGGGLVEVEGWCEKWWWETGLVGGSVSGREFVEVGTWWENGVV